MIPYARLTVLMPHDPVSRTWTKARYTEWMIDGEPEIRGRVPASTFNPYPRHVPLTASDVDLDAAIRDELERIMVACFLRRYVTYCARRRRFAAMQGAAALHRTLVSGAES